MIQTFSQPKSFMLYEKRMLTSCSQTHAFLRHLDQILRQSLVDLLPSLAVV